MESERQKAKPVYGNYVNYYSKRDVSEGIQELDSRLQLIPPAYLRNKVILDLGCNTGRVSIQLASQLEAKRVVGIDIDEALIRRAVVESTFYSLLPFLDRRAEGYDFSEKDMVYSFTFDFDRSYRAYSLFVQLLSKFHVENVWLFTDPTSIASYGIIPRCQWECECERERERESDRR